VKTQYFIYKCRSLSLLLNQQLQEEWWRSYHQNSKTIFDQFKKYFQTKIILTIDIIKLKNYFSCIYYIWMNIIKIQLKDKVKFKFFNVAVGRLN